MLRTFFFPAAYMDKLMLKTVVTRFCSDDRDRVLSLPSGSLLIGKSHWRIAQLPKQPHQRDPLPFFLFFFPGEQNYSTFDQSCLYYISAVNTQKINCAVSLHLNIENNQCANWYTPCFLLIVMLYIVAWSI